MASQSNSGGGRRIPWRVAGWSIPVVLLLIPLFAGFPWTFSDFLFAAILFAAVGVALELAVRASGDPAYRGGAAVATGTAFLLVWINLAVGIIGDEDNPANLMFFGVIAAAFIGAIVARFEAAGIARAMTVAAVLQASIGALVLIKGLGANGPPGPLRLMILIETFAGAWAVSGLLFRRAARRPSS